jgi:hypothetical protein
MCFKAWFNYATVQQYKENDGRESEYEDSEGEREEIR